MHLEQNKTLADLDENNQINIIDVSIVAMDMEKQSSAHLHPYSLSVPLSLSTIHKTWFRDGSLLS